MASLRIRLLLAVGQYGAKADGERCLMATATIVNAITGTARIQLFEYGVTVENGEDEDDIDDIIALLVVIAFTLSWRSMKYVIARHYGRRHHYITLISLCFVVVVVGASRHTAMFTLRRQIYGEEEICREHVTIIDVNIGDDTWRRLNGYKHTPEITRHYAARAIVTARAVASIVTKTARRLLVIWIRGQYAVTIALQGYGETPLVEHGWQALLRDYDS